MIQGLVCVLNILRNDKICFSEIYGKFNNLAKKSEKK